MKFSVSDDVHSDIVEIVYRAGNTSQVPASIDARITTRTSKLRLNKTSSPVSFYINSLPVYSVIADVSSHVSGEDVSQVPASNGISGEE
jgi:hypothetical protein